MKKIIGFGKNILKNLLTITAQGCIMASQTITNGKNERKGETMMEHYDYRVIDGCGVYSYTVEAPASHTRAVRESAPKPARKSKNARRAVKKVVAADRESQMKKWLLSLLFVLLSPFALFGDALVAVFRFATQKLYGLFRGHGAAAGVLGTACCMIFLSAMLFLI